MSKQVLKVVKATRHGPFPGTIIPMVRIVWENGNKDQCDLSDVLDNCLKENWFTKEQVREIEKGILAGNAVIMRVGTKKSVLFRMSPLWGHDEWDEAFEFLRKWKSENKGKY